MCNVIDVTGSPCVFPPPAAQTEEELELVSEVNRSLRNLWHAHV